MDKFALLLRLNPERWPNWERQIVQNTDATVWFKTGPRLPEDIHPGIPVIVLGTGGLGVVASGKTSSNIEFRSDPDWQDASQEYQEECKQTENRVCVKIRRVSVALTELKKQPNIAKLDRRRKTTTWIASEQYQAIKELIER